MSQEQKQIGSDISKQSFLLSEPGYVSLHRQIRSHWVYQDASYLKLWIEFLLLAAYHNHEVVLNGKVVSLRKGQFIFGRDSFAKRLNLTSSKVRKFVNEAETHRMISRVRCSKYSIISIVNYEKFQKSPAKRPTSRQQSTSTAPHTNKVNKVNKVNKTGYMKYDEGYGI